MYDVSNHHVVNHDENAFFLHSIHEQSGQTNLKQKVLGFWLHIFQINNFNIVPALES